MADNLIFPIGFDLQKAVDGAIQDWDKTYAKRLEQAIAKRPVRIKLDFEKLEDVKMRLAQLKIEPITPETRFAIKDLAQELQQLAKALEQVQKYSSRNGGPTEAVRNSQIALNEQKAAAAHELARQRAARAAIAEEKLTQVRLKSVSGINAQNKAYATQSSYVGNLLRKMAALWSVHRVQSFLVGVRDVTAEFELQRVSLGAIIQDQKRANQLFSEIKAFALKSPISIMDLTKYTKQLAAYKIETNELFETTKRLADVSVGLGVSMDRIILAYGQVKAASYLRASEIRQFTEAGIPMLELLAEKFTKLQGKVVSTADVMDMVSKRMVGFGMVKEIFEDMTSAGGMFYNMQEKQGNTLFGMWAKLGDAASVMYDEIGNTRPVNESIKNIIKGFTELMKNWRIVAKYILAGSAALGIYVIAKKQATIASKALSAADATTIATQKAQTINLYKLIQHIDRKNAATMAAAKLQSLYTKSAIKAAMATNILTKGFWGLTTAILANPVTSLLFGIISVVSSVLDFGQATADAKRSMEEMEASTQSSITRLNELNDDIDPLLARYKELSSNVNRSTEEQEEFVSVMDKLAARYPNAISSVDQYNGKVKELSKSLFELNQRERERATATLQSNKRSYEAQANMMKAEIQRYQAIIDQFHEVAAQLKAGVYAPARLRDVLSADQYKTYITKAIEEGIDEANGYALDIIENIYGHMDKKGKIEEFNEYLNDAIAGHERLLGLIKAIKIALGEEVEEATAAIKEAGGWKEHLQSVVMTVNGSPMRLLNDEQINQFQDLHEALEAIAKIYKEAKEKSEDYAKAIQSETISEEIKNEIKTSKEYADASKDMAYNTLDFYNALSFLIKKVGQGRHSDPRLQILNDIANKMAQINKEYDDLLKKEGHTKALADTQKLFASSFADMQKVADKYKFKLPAFEVPQTIEDVQKWYDAIIKEINRLGIKNADKILIELGFKRDKSAIDKQQKQIEQQLKTLADRISRTKTAREFYDKVLGMTGDYQLAAKVSLQIYGSTGSDLKEQTKEQFAKAFEGLKSDHADIIPEVTEIIDREAYEELRDYIQLLPEDAQKAADDLVKAQQQMSTKQYEQWINDLKKAQNYAEKRIELSRYTANQIIAIEERIAKLNPQAADYEQHKAMLEKLIAGYRNREDKEAATLEYEAFKDTPLYIQMFEDLGQASSYALESMKEKLLGLQNVWGSALDPTQLKEIQNRINEIDAQLRVRNPFKTLRESYQQYHDALKNYTVLGAEENVASAQASYDKAVKDTGSADSKEAKAAERTLEIEKQKLEIAKQLTDEKGKALKGQKSLDEAARIANENEAQARVELAAATAAEKRATAEGGDVKAAHEAVEAAKEKLNLAQATSEIIQNEAKTPKTLKESWSAVGQTIGNIGAGIKEVGQSISAMMEAFGSEAEDIQFVDDISNAVGDIFAGVGDIIQSALSGDVVGIVTGAITAPLKIITGFANLFSAGKVRRANKEIKRQQKLLDQLEYTYGRLEKAADKAFGAEHIANYNQRIRNLYAQQQAYQKQAQAERSKGKKADKDKIKEYENQARDTADKIKDVRDELQEYFAGTDITSAARDFANAWIDAKKSFESTTDSMREKFADMIQNMIVEAMAAKIMETSLQGFYKSIDEAVADGHITAEEIAKSAEIGIAAIGTMNNSMEVLWAQLKAAGIDLEKILGDSEGNVSGISRDIASASEESINGLAAGINTQNYYISHVPTISENVAAIRQLMERGTMSSIPESATAGWTDWQQQAMDNYNAIARNTAETVAECRRSAAACEAFAADIHRMIDYSGGKPRLNVKL